jgi:hypothetical protein
MARTDRTYGFNEGLPSDPIMKSAVVVLDLQAQIAISVLRAFTRSLAPALAAKKASTLMTDSARSATVLVSHATALLV